MMSGRAQIFGMYYEYFFTLLFLSPFIYMFLKRFLPWLAKKLNELDAWREAGQKK